MGHLKLGRLPLYRNWRKVVAALEDDSQDLETIAAKTAHAARSQLEAAAKSPYVWYPYWFMIQLAQSAQDDEAFYRFLDDYDIHIRDDLSAVGAVAQIQGKVQESLAKLGPRNALDELSLNVFHRALTGCALEGEHSLFDSEVEELRIALSNFAPSRAFSRLTQNYLGTFYGEILSYFLSYELGNHIGENRRFDSVRDAEEFNRNLKTYAQQVSQLVGEFSEGWHSKKLWKEGEINQDSVIRFLHIGFRKFQQQLDLEIQS